MKPLITAIAIAGICSLTACNRGATQEREAALRQHTVDSMNIELARKNTIDSMNTASHLRDMTVPVITAPAAPVATAPTRTIVRRTHTNNYYSNGNASQPATVYQQPAPQRKRGWSAKAKGALIGAGTGAAAGAIIDRKNRGAGAVIGGLIGAGAGTGAGAIIDHKKGR